MQHPTLRVVRLMAWCLWLFLPIHAHAATRLALPPIETFIIKWTPSGGSELGSSQTFLTELCDLLELPRPQAPRPDLRDTSYLFEAPAPLPLRDDKASQGRIDLYKRGCFIWESKQGSPQRPQDAQEWRRGTATRGTHSWDAAMMQAKAQAEAYARALPASEGRPPFVIIADIGHSIEIFADFRASGVYTPFPSARENRLTLDDLRKAEVRELLRTIWTDPLALDPSRESAKVTQTLALQLADMAESLEKSGYSADEASLFLQRCIFTMFAEDVGLVPHASFTRLLAQLQATPEAFTPALTALWQSMSTGGYSETISGTVARVESPLFVQARALPLNAAQIALLHTAAQAQWAAVDTAIFGTLLEHALSPQERHKLGAHYTPPAYVARLVVPTIIAPLREAWETAKDRTLAQIRQNSLKAARNEVEDFFRHLRGVTVLDPSCGSGNFLALSLTLMKTLEGEVVQALRDLGASEQEIFALGAVGPHQFKGIEVVPRAAAISALVLWTTALQQHYAIHGNVPPPAALLQPAIAIECRDAVLAWNADGTARQADPWPQADFIVGNPPFVGNFKMRGALGARYTEALRSVYPELSHSTEYVMYWWHRAATLVGEGKALRFGLITTNSIRQVKNRAVVERHLQANPPLSLLFAIPDHPWIDAKDGAQVRIAMTVGGRGPKSGTLLTPIPPKRGVKRDASMPSMPSFKAHVGNINANLTIGVDMGKVQSLRANKGIASRGVETRGNGFIITEKQAKELGLGTVQGIDMYIRRYQNGRDLAGISRNQYVLDLFGLTIDEVKNQYPKVYAHILAHVKPVRDTNARDASRLRWWIFGEARPELRKALQGLARYIVSPETARRRYFVFLDTEILPDNKLVAIACDDAYILGVLSSSIHQHWALATGGRLGVGNDPVYVKSTAFDAFPFPISTEQQKASIRAIAEQLDAHRKARQGLHPKLTLTDTYAVLEQVRNSGNLSPKEQRIREQADIPTLLALHDKLEAVVADAYGWPANLSPDAILTRLCTLNQERAAEEKHSLVRWLRPALQAQQPGIKK